MSGSELGPYFLGFPLGADLALWAKPRSMAHHAGTALLNPIAGNTELVAARAGYVIYVDNYRVILPGNISQAAASINPIQFAWGAIALYEPIAMPFVPAVAGTGPTLFDTGFVSLQPAMLVPLTAVGATGANLALRLTVALVGTILVSIGWHYEKY